MRNKIIMNVLVLVLAVAMIAAATMAWFTDKAEAGKAVFTAGTVSIEAGRNVVADEGVEFYQDTVYGTFYPVRVVKYEQGLDLKEKKVLGIRSNPEATLGKPDVTITGYENFYSLGFGGWIELEFDHSIYASNKVIVIETTGGTYPPEQAIVYVSDTGKANDWEEVGIASIEGVSGNPKYINIPIGELEDTPYIKFIKLFDVTDPNDFIVYQGNTPDGFDLNAVSIEGYTQEEDNWNPGDENERIYTVINTGTKAINLRGKLTGEWYKYKEETGKWVKCNLPDDVVSFELPEGETDWVKEGDFFYYKQSIQGTYNGAPLEERTVELIVKVCLDGPLTGNEYQGKRFIVKATFEAIQASNGAAEASGWYIPQNDD